MTRICVSFCFAVFAMFGSVLAAGVSPAYKGKAAGLHASFVVTDDYLYYDNNIAPGGGVQADVFFTLLGPGKFAWSPSVAVVGHSNRNGNYAAHERWVQWEFNLADFKYFPSFASSMPVKPYAGLGGPALVIHHFRSEYDRYNNPYWWHDDETRAEAAFNFIAGVDFIVSEKVYPYLEVREQVSNYNTFRITGGFNVIF